MSTDVMTPGRTARGREPPRPAAGLPPQARRTAPGARRAAAFQARQAATPGIARPARCSRRARSGRPARSARLVLAGQAARSGPAARPGRFIPTIQAERDAQVRSGGQPASTGAERARHAGRTSFVMLVLGLLGGGLICLLVVNTTLAANSIRSTTCGRPTRPGRSASSS